MRIPAPSTSEKLIEYHAQYVAWHNALPEHQRAYHMAGWRGVGQQLDWHYSTLADVAKGRPGCITAKKENKLRRVLGLPALRIEEAPCPDCGAWHVIERCYGRNLTGFIPTPPCPTCGQPHNVDAQGVPLDCHGKEGQAVWRQATPSRPARRRVRIDVTGLSTEQRQQVAAFVASLRGGGARTVTETGGV